MRVPFKTFSVLSLAIATVIALATPQEAFAQRGGGGGGRGGGGGGGGGRSAGPGGGGQRGGPPQAGNRGGNPGRGGPSWSGGNRGGGPSTSGGRGADRGTPSSNRGSRDGGRGDYRNDNRPRGSANLNQFYGNRYGSGWYGGGYRGQYNSGYRGNIGFGGPGFGRPGFGPGFGNYGYGYFPWYVGLATYGAGMGRGFGNFNAYGQGAPIIIERSAPAASPGTLPPEEDYVPQLNQTSTVLGSGAAGTAVLGITMDPQYPNAAVVREVTPGSAAEQAGLRPGDMITMIDQQPISSPADVTNIVGAQQPGAAVRMEFVRPILRSEVREAAPEEGLGLAAPAPAETAEAETLPPAAPQPPTPSTPEAN